MSTIKNIKNKREWNKLSAEAFDHPYFDKSRNRLSEREAERLLRQHDIADGRAVLEQIRGEINAEEISDVAEVSMLAKRFTQKRTRSSWIRWGASAAVLLMFMGFFAFTEPGTALAQDARNMIVQLFGSALHGQDETPKKARIEDFDFMTLSADVASAQEVAELTGREIAVLSETDEQLQSFSAAAVGSDMIVLHTRYTGPAGQGLMISQTLFNSVLWESASKATSDAKPITSRVGIQFYVGAIGDGTVFAEAYAPEYQLSIASYGLTLDALIELVDAIRFI